MTLSKQQAEAIGTALTAQRKARLHGGLARYPELSAYPPEERAERLREAMDAARWSWPVLAAFALALALVTAAVVLTLWLKSEAGPLAFSLVFVAAGVVQSVHRARVRKNLRAARLHVDAGG